jgi:uncharacterized protein YyaL (SSP411 family)
LWGRERYKAAADAIYRYLTSILQSPEGAFYTSQDADLSAAINGKAYYALGDKERRALGLPGIDKSIYARENGWAIRALLAYYAGAGESAALDRAKAAAHWVMENRRLTGGGFRHGESDRGGPFLADSLAMGEALLDLYGATGERAWLAEAGRTADFIGSTFKNAEAGFNSAAKEAAASGVFASPYRQIEENEQLARFLNRLSRYTGKAAYRAAAEHAMHYLASETVTQLPRFLAGVLLADSELAAEPTHITVVGHKDDPAARALHEAAWRYPAVYKRVDWWDTREGPMTNADIVYPELDQAAAFACSNRICSLPIFEAAALAKTVSRLSNERAGSRRQASQDR